MRAADRRGKQRATKVRSGPQKREASGMAHSGLEGRSGPTGCEVEWVEARIRLKRRTSGRRGAQLGTEASRFGAKALCWTQRRAAGRSGAQWATEIRSRPQRRAAGCRGIIHVMILPINTKKYTPLKILKKGVAKTIRIWKKMPIFASEYHFLGENRP